MRIEFSIEEISEIENLLQERLAELADEIHHARVSRFREQLRNRKALLESLLKKLKNAASPAF